MNKKTTYTYVCVCVAVGAVIYVEQYWGTRLCGTETNVYRWLDRDAYLFHSKLN